MEFGAPENLVYIWLVPLVLVICFFAEKSRKKRLKMVGIIKTANRGEDPVPVSFFKTLLKTLLIALAFVCIVLALAKPRWGFEWIDAKQRGADIMIAVDVSQSMMAPDVSPSRLERAKRKISDLLDNMSGDRVGLVAFAGTAFVQCPLTMDYGAVRLFLSYLDPELIPTQGTDLGSAIDMSLAGLFDGAPEENTTGRAIIVMTDGEDQEGRGLKAAETAKSKGVKIYTLGIGTEEGTLIPEPGGGFKKDRSGNLVISKPNEPTLKAMAQASGGSYIRSVASDADIRFIYDKGILKDLNREENQEIRSKRWHERFQWFLAAAFACLFIEPLVRDVRLPMSLLLAGLFLFKPQTVQAASESDAHDFYKKKEYGKAAEEFSQLEKEKPEDPDVTYNRAVSQYRNGDFKGAAEGFGRSAGSDNKELQEKSWYNLGNSFAYMQKFDDAIKSYENALQINPENQKAKENLALVKQMQEQQKKQKQNDKNESDKNQENNQEQNQDSKDGQQQDSQQQQDQVGEKKDQQQADEQNQQGEGQKQDTQKEQDGQKSNEQKQAQSSPDEQNKSDQPDQGKQQEEKENEKEQMAEQGKENEQEGKDEQETNHNQGNQTETKELQQSRQYTADQATQLLRSVEDQIKKYRYMDQSGKGQKQDPEKDW